MALVQYRMGKDAKVYYGTQDVVDPDSMTEVSRVKDVTVSLEAGQADVTTRASGGWRSNAPTLRSCSATFQLIMPTTANAIVEAFRDAFLNGTFLALAILDDDRDTVDAQGPLGNFGVVSFNRAEPLEDAVVYDVTAQLYEFVEWHIVAAASS